MHLALLKMPRLAVGMIFVVSVFAGTACAQDSSAALKQADAAYREGVAALNASDLKTAQSKFEAVVKLAPAAEPGHSALGAVLVREGQTAAGIHELEKALAINTGDDSAQTNLALAYEQTGAAAKALPLFAKLQLSARAQKHPLPEYLLVPYGRALVANGQTIRAIAILKEAAAQEPKDAELRDELGSLFAQRQDWQQAEQELNDAIALKPNLATAHLHLGFVLEAEKKPGADNEWMLAYEAGPNDASIALQAGRALADRGFDDRAIPILEQARRLDPNSTAAAYQLGIVLQRANRVEEAVPLLKSVVAAEPKNADALTNLGMALTQQHNAKEGVPYLQRAVAAAPQNPTAHQDLAAAFLQINQVDDAIVELRAAIALSPNAPQLHYNLGVAYKLQDDAAHAIPELEQAEKLDPSAYEPAYVLGLLYMQSARYQEAAAQLESSLKLHPENGEGWATLGSVDNKLDKLTDAEAALREAARQLPDQADPHLTLAAVLVKQNKPGEAAEERKLAANLMRTHMNLQRAEVATNSGKSLLANGKIDEAVAQFRDALTFDSTYAEAHLALAKALEKQGKTAEAASERAQAEALAGASK